MGVTDESTRGSKGSQTLVGSWRSSVGPAHAPAQVLVTTKARGDARPEPTAAIGGLVRVGSAPLRLQSETKRPPGQKGTGSVISGR